jgi:hypothetical protein
MTADHDGLQKLREPFPKSVIGKLPKGNTTLDFVGHAAVTDRLLSIDPLWNWEPLVVDERGFPARDPEGALWIRLTVCGVTRLGVSDPKETNKVAIGDAIRNAAMRFGVALDLWTKDDLESQAGTDATRRREIPAHGPVDGPPATPGQHAHLDALAEMGRITASWDRENDAWRFAEMARLRDEKGWPKKVGEYTRAQAHEACAAARALDEEPFPLDQREVSQEVPEGMPASTSEQPAGGSGVEPTDEQHGEVSGGGAGSTSPAPVDNPPGASPRARTRKAGQG